MKKTRAELKTIIAVLLLSLSVLATLSAFWGVKYFQVQNFEQIMFHLSAPLEGTNADTMISWSSECLKPTLWFLGILSATIFLLKLTNQFSDFRRTIHRYAMRLVLIPLSATIIIASVLYSVPEYLLAKVHSSSLYEEHYVDPSQVEFTFNEKRNLVYIYLESMESTFTTSEMIEFEGINENGTPELMQVQGSGFQTDNLIPNLSRLAAENTNFSNTEGIGGAQQVANVGWTIAAMVAQTSGVPLSLPIDMNKVESEINFLPGVYSLGEILQKEGYNQSLMVGSAAEFGGRSYYHEQHGDYDIFDLQTAKDREYIPQDYNVWWGFEDGKLFDYAKMEVETLASKDEPFNFTMLTVNTHNQEGWIEDSCEFYTGEDNYLTSVLCSDQQVYDFVTWLQEQPFYENTTIVISGDHLSMNKSYMDTVDLYEDTYKRTVFNTFINSAVEDVNSKNRTFTTMDMYPTTLKAMGVTWEGGRLGLGVNLYSGEPTLAEEYGIKEFNDLIRLHSKYYNEEIAGRVKK